MPVVRPVRTYTLVSPLLSTATHMLGLLDTVPLACATWLCFLVAMHLRRVRAYKKIYPPGPQGLPLLGNILSMPKAFEWIHYQELGNTYGNVNFKMPV